MKSSRLFAYLQLMRPANIVTAMADILAGVSVALASYGVTDKGLAMSGFSPAGYLLLSTLGLYGGGVVFNDVFDAELDAIERPERPIPSGRASRTGASILGMVLMLAGITAAFQVSVPSGGLAIAIAFFALLYNKVGKHKVWGPFNMGLCRGLNVALGMSINASAGFYTQWIGYTSWWVLLNLFFHPFHILAIPILYIYAITAVSRGEVHGHSRKAFVLPFFLYGLVIVLLLGIYPPPGCMTLYWERLPFLILLIILIFPPLLRAYRDPQPKHIGLAVKAGVISLIALDATLAAVFAGWVYGLCVLALLPVSRLLARFFAVT